MKKFIYMVILVFCSANTFGQNYERKSVCGSDAIDVDFVTKTGERIKYKAFECTQVSRLGIRVDLGFNMYAYNSKTKNWLGDHNGALFGLALIYDEFNFGVKFKPATVRPATELDFEGNILTKNAKLNPVKVDYDISYSINIRHNISVEPYLALTSNNFYVINEDELNKQYKIPKATGLTVGFAINKYFHLKSFQFLAVFAKYGHGFTNYKKIHNSLGKGYSDMSFGIAYKGFIKRKFLRKA